MYEVPMDYSASNPYKKYKFDTGLSEIPYGKKKFSSLEGGEFLNETLLKSYFKNKTIFTEQYVKFLVKALKIEQISKCNNYVLIENKVYDVKNKKIVKQNNVLTESIVWKNVSVINEGLTWWANLGQNLLSIGSMVANVFVPGSGLAIEFANGIIYLLRGWYSADKPDLQNALYLNGAITLGFTLLGAGFGGGAAVGLKALIGSGKLAGGVVAKALIWLSGKVGYLFGRILNFLSRGLSDKTIRFIARFIPALRPPAGVTGKAATKHIIGKCTDVLNSIQTRLTSYLNKLVAKGAGQTGKTLTKGVAGSTLNAATKATVLSMKLKFAKFLGLGGKNIITKNAAAKAGQLLPKMGFQAGSVINSKGVEYTVIKMLGSKVQLAAKGGTPFNIGADKLLGKVLKTNVFKNYANLIIKNPSSNALGARFLAGFIFGGDGSLEDVNLEGMPNIDIASQIGEENLNIELASYEGGTGQYTVNNEVTAVQNALQTLSKDLGAAGIDGKYGPITKAAINSVETDMGAKQTAGSITVQTVATIISALVQAGKIAEAKKLAESGIKDANIKGKIQGLLDSSSPTAAAIQGAVNSSAGVGGTVSNAVSQVMSNTGALTENTFSESYKRMFGLTLD
jgi:peptidoglycan hydrolase-like protein with peptidoglycan-binding domain